MKLDSFVDIISKDPFVVLSDVIFYNCLLYMLI